MSNPENRSIFSLSISEKETINTLGLVWQPSQACFKFVFKPWAPPFQLTRRTLVILMVY